MKKEVLITVKGMQGDLDDTIEMMTRGHMYEKNNNVYILYVDTALDSEVETKTSIKVNQNKVVVTRFGATKTHMIFECDKEHFAFYETSLGLFEILLRTNQIDIQNNDHDFHLKIDYNMELNQMPIPTSIFELSAIEVNN